MSYIAKKPLAIGGKEYRIGDEIPEKAVLNPSALLAAQLIAEANLGQGDGSPLKAEVIPLKVSAPVLSSNGISRIDLTAEETETALLFSQLSAEEAVKTAGTLKAGPLAEYLISVEKRKKVQEALKAITSEQPPANPEDGQPSTGPDNGQPPADPNDEQTPADPDDGKSNSEGEGNGGE